MAKLLYLPFMRWVIGPRGMVWKQYLGDEADEVYTYFEGPAGNYIASPASPSETDGEWTPKNWLAE